MFTFFFVDIVLGKGIVKGNRSGVVMRTFHLSSLNIELPGASQFMQVQSVSPSRVKERSSYFPVPASEDTHQSVCHY